ncbi:hypothetical protein AAG906_036901 [Vitis piasezkii]
MGDLLGSPRVAPLFPFYDGISTIYVRTCRANRFRPSHFHPDRPIVDRTSRSSAISRRSAQTLTFSELRGPSYGPKRLSSLVSPSVRRKDDPSPPLRSSRRDSWMIRAHHCDPCVKTCGLKKQKNGPQTLPKGPKNHLASSCFNTSLTHPLKSRSNPNPCVNFKRDTPSYLDEHPQILA